MSGGMEGYDEALTHQDGSPAATGAPEPGSGTRDAMEAAPRPAVSASGVKVADAVGATTGATASAAVGADAELLVALTDMVLRPPQPHVYQAMAALEAEAAAAARCFMQVCLRACG